MAVTKMFSYTLWPWAYFTNKPDAAASSAPTPPNSALIPNVGNTLT